LTAKTDLSQPPNDDVADGAGCIYACQLVDGDNVAVPLSSIATLTLSLMTDGYPPAVVNGVDQTSILNVDRGAVDAEGNVTVTLGANDTALVAPVGGIELRSIILTWTYGTAPQTGRHEAVFKIVALAEP
jgi:hypothetical protein